MSYAFLDIRIGNSPSNRVIIQLFEEDAPETCKFFKFLLSHENGYRGTRFERVIEEFMIQGGDVGMEDDASIPRGPASMESIERAVDKPGLVGLARKSVAEINAQFFITLGNAEHLQGVHTIFGQVVKGMEFVKKISEVEVDDDDVPVAGYEVTITDCGELQKRKKWEPPARKSISPERKYRQLQNEEDKEERIENEPSWGDTDNYRTRYHSPLRRDEDRGKRSRTPDSDSDKQKRHPHEKDKDSGNHLRKSVPPERKYRQLQDEGDKEESSENEPSRGDTNQSRSRFRSPPRRTEGRGKRSRTPDSDSDAQKRHRHHHHRHHHRRHRKSANEDDEKEQNGHSSAAKPRERSHSPQRRKQHPPDTSQSRDIESNRGREYIPRRQERRESNYGRLGFVSGYDDEIRDDEYHLRDVERMREDDREKVEPAVKFKGRGAMKFLENRRREYRY